MYKTEVIDTNNIFLKHIRDEDECVVIHSALHRLAVSPTNLKWGLLRSIRDLSARGKTVLIPSFTFSFTNKQRIDWVNSASEVGLLGEWSNDLMDSVRTLHPIYSFVCFGNDQTRILNCNTKSAFGKKSVFEFLAKRRTRIVMLGAQWKDCTQFHYYEELFQVPYRFYKTFRGEAKKGTVIKPIATSMYVRDLDLGVVNDFSPAIDLLNQRNMIQRTTHHEHVASVSIKNLGDVCGELLSADKYAFVEQPERIKSFVKYKEKRLINSPLRILIFGSQNNELLRAIAKAQFNNYFPDRDVEVSITPVNQTAEVLYKNNSKNKYDLVIAVERLEDMIIGGNVDGDPEFVASRVKSYLADLVKLANSVGKLLVVNLFFRYSPDMLGASGVAVTRGIRNVVNDSNNMVIDQLKDYENIILLDSEELITIEGFQVGDERLYYLGRIPFSEVASTHFAKKWVGCFLSYSARTIRLLVVDLDNTLWGGVVGEDGIQGIALGGDYPGNAYSNLQQTLKALSDRGLILAVISKNEEHDAFNVIDNHPDMVLRREDFASYRINWSDKASNMIDLVNEIGIGLEYVGFLDDNPVEREMMRQRLPEVKVVELGEDPVMYSKNILANPYLQVIDITEEDKARASSYSERVKIKTRQKNFNDIQNFYHDLNVRLFIQNLDEFSLARAHQLVQKTNQFNSTTTRYSKEELLEKKDRVFVLAAEDKYSKRENLGLVITKLTRTSEVIVTDFLLSCRVLGKGIENAVMSWLIEEARKDGQSKIIFNFNKTERNTPVEQLFISRALKKHQDYYLVDDILKQRRVRDWVTVVDERRGNQV